MEEHSGFVVSVAVSLPTGQVYLTGRLSDGRSFAAVDRNWKPSLSIRAAQEAAATRLLAARRDLRAEIHPTDFTSFNGEACVALETEVRCFAAWARALGDAGIETFRGDMKLKDLYRVDRGLRGGVALSGERRPGRRVAVVFPDAEVRAVENPASLEWVSIDIETSRAEEIRAMAIASKEGEDLFFAGPELSLPRCACFPTEKEMLAAFQERMVALDPDVITGWNLVDFDLRVIARRLETLGLDFDLGRSRESSKYLSGTGGASASVIIPGRQVVDAMRVARSGPERFEDLRLETVAQAVLGEGKSVTASGEDKLEALEKLAAEDPVAYCRYCARDARLVLEILAKTGLGDLTVLRAAATGLSLDRAWTSIPAFEQLYAILLHGKRVLPPTLSAAPPGSAAGGLILEPTPGLFDHVLVLDFKSLYPTIIRTFHIDPLARARAGADDAITAPNGARFSREIGLLPPLIADWFKRREEARKAGDAAGSHVYKILMNSFYGVLGAGGCRYASSALAGAVTSFGQKYLTWTRDWASARGLRVLYGDTDSVFLMPGPGERSPKAWNRFGSETAEALNHDLAAAVKREYGVACFLEIKLEKVFDRFYLPRLRSGHGERGEEAKGRAKGYAGRILSEGGAGRRIEIKGMEAIRSDGTAFARRFQRELLAMALDRRSADELRAHVEQSAQALLSGALDGELVYRKMLRHAPEDYRKNEPPHVRAARLLGWKNRRGRIEYVITRNGAEPSARRTAPLDRRHYLTHQLVPIAESVAETLGMDLLGAMPGSGQLEMRW